MATKIKAEIEIIINIITDVWVKSYFVTEALIQIANNMFGGI